MENYKQSIVNVIQQFFVQLGNDIPQLQDVIDQRYLGLMQEIDRIPMELPMSVDNVSIASSRNTNDSEVRKYSNTIVWKWILKVVLFSQTFFLFVFFLGFLTMLVESLYFLRHLSNSFYDFYRKLEVLRAKSQTQEKERDQQKDWMIWVSRICSIKASPL